MTSRPPRPVPAVRLTPRGRRTLSLVVLGCLGLLVVSLLGSLLRGCGGSPEQGAPPPSSSAPAEPSPTPSLAPSSPAPTSPASASTSDDDIIADTDGLKRTGLLGKGTWKVAKLTAKPARKTPAVHRYIVRVEDGTGLDPVAAAREVASVLNDPRGWTGHQGNSFELVSDQAKADFVISLASPGRVQKMCPLDVKMTWSCRAGKDVLLNTDRWQYMTPTYDDLTSYRAYLVNHEVGHFIGKGHVGCPAKGRNAPVMMQQSKRIDGCRPNAWPSQDGK